MQSKESWDDVISRATHSETSQHEILNLENFNEIIYVTNNDAFYPELVRCNYCDNTVLRATFIRHIVEKHSNVLVGAQLDEFKYLTARVDNEITQSEDQNLPPTSQVVLEKIETDKLENQNDIALEKSLNGSKLLDLHIPELGDPLYPMVSVEDIYELHQIVKLLKKEMEFGKIRDEYSMKKGLKTSDVINMFELLLKTKMRQLQIKNQNYENGLSQHVDMEKTDETICSEIPNPESKISIIIELLELKPIIDELITLKLPPVKTSQIVDFYAENFLSNAEHKLSQKPMPKKFIPIRKSQQIIQKNLVSSQKTPIKNACKVTGQHIERDDLSYHQCIENETLKTTQSTTSNIIAFKNQEQNPYDSNYGRKTPKNESDTKIRGNMTQGIIQNTQIKSTNNVHETPQINIVIQDSTMVKLANPPNVNIFSTQAVAITNNSTGQIFSTSPPLEKNQETHVMQYLEPSIPAIKRSSPESVSTLPLAGLQPEQGQIVHAVNSYIDTGPIDDNYFERLGASQRSPPKTNIEQLNRGSVNPIPQFQVSGQNFTDNTYIPNSNVLLVKNSTPSYVIRPQVANVQNTPNQIYQVVNPQTDHNIILSEMVNNNVPDFSGAVFARNMNTGTVRLQPGMQTLSSHELVSIQPANPSFNLTQPGLQIQPPRQVTFQPIPIQTPMNGNFINPSMVGVVNPTNMIAIAQPHVITHNTIPLGYQISIANAFAVNATPQYTVQPTYAIQMQGQQNYMAPNHFVLMNNPPAQPNIFVQPSPVIRVIQSAPPIRQTGFNSSVQPFHQNNPNLFPHG
ncbi:hypothetical protein RF11_09028 [Thelohanellus kitauei]|uniref:Uncharacterized protein n=1 Tax=Thelohanellus kitauei TaxID=669202 RepID=A0A0C2JK14_THEKT|nr:hypothetical protein RF11_09028 [Thelohanellus kitauei]